MRIFLTGATGHIGSAVLRRLVDGGHTVTALVRSLRHMAELRSDAVTPVLGDLERPQDFARAVAETDGLIHTGSPGHYSLSIVDDGFISTALRVLAGTHKPFVMTSGLWVYGSGDDLREADPPAPPPLVSWRPELSDRVRNAPGVRGIVIAPGIVHSRGRGMHTMIAAQRVQRGGPALMTIGSGRQHWSCIDVDDLADLYVRALERAPAGSTFIGARGDSPTVYEISRALSRRLGFDGRTVTETDQAAVARMGQLGQALLLDQQASGAHAQRVLDWTPRGPSLLEAIRTGPSPVSDAPMPILLRIPRRPRPVTPPRPVTADRG